MNDPVKNGIDYNREYFAHLDEFFVRATGKSAAEFSSIENFVDVAKANASSIGGRADDAFPWLDTVFRVFVAKRGADAFSDARRLGGMNLALGGSSRFGQSQLNSTLTTVLYSDTVFVPDPVLPWLETERSEEKFRHVLLLQAVHALLHLKPLVDADLPLPPIFVFPSWEKLLEENDEQTQLGISQLVADVLSNCFGERLASLEDVLEYADKFPDQTLNAIDSKHLYVAPGGPIEEPLDRALSRYEDEISTWRSEEWLRNFRDMPAHRKVISGVLERLGPIYHLIENAQELNSNPLLCIEQQAHYFRIVSETGSARLEELNVIDPKTIGVVNALGSQRLSWIAGIPVETLVELRQNNENLEFRRRLDSSVQLLHESDLKNIDRLAAEVCRDLRSAIGEHDNEMRAIQERYDRAHGTTAVAGLAAAGAALMPALAPLLGSVAPLALAAKYGHDKVAERAEKRSLEKSLVGVLALSQRQG